MYSVGHQLKKEKAVEDELPVDKLVRIYMKMRSAIQDLDAQIEAIKEQQQSVKNEIKDRMRGTGVKSLRTDHGTVSLMEKTRYYTNDWDSFKKFMVEHDALDLLEKRIAQSNMKLFLEENPGAIPPGLNSDTEFDISVRKPSTK
jgi:DNA repair exonuclease SbcCD ATPase subunit